MTRSEYTRRHALKVALGATGIALAGCLDPGTGVTSNEAQPPTEPGGTLGDPAEAVTVRLASAPRPLLEPGLVHLLPGGTIEWIGEGIRNTVAAYHPDVGRPLRIPPDTPSWHSGLLRAGSRFTWQFDAEGIYDYVDVTEVCGSHETYGLVGRIVVGWPDLEGQPAIEHDCDELPGRAARAMHDFDERCRAVLVDDASERKESGP